MAQLFSYECFLCSVLKDLNFSLLFSETIAACDLRVGRCRPLIDLMKICDNSRSRSFLNNVLYVLC